MTKFLDDAVQTVRRLPPDDQDEIARVMLSLAHEGDAGAVDPAHLPAVLEGMAQVLRGEFASDEEVEAAFSRFGA